MSPSMARGGRKAVGQQGGIFRPWGEDAETRRDVAVVKEEASSTSAVKQESSLTPPSNSPSLTPVDIALRGLEQRQRQLPRSTSFPFPSASSSPPFPFASSPSLEQLSQLMRLSNSLATEDLAHQLQLNERRTRPKKFRCNECGAGFSNNGQLRGHVRIHTGERPFRCPHSACGKAFTRNEELTRHRRIHTGVKPFQCPGKLKQTDLTHCGRLKLTFLPSVPGCSKPFGRKDHLKKHLKTHERPPMPCGPFMPLHPLLPPGYCFS